MSLTSYSFLLFCSIVVILYYTVCKRVQYQLLLIASIVFYASFSYTYLVVLGYIIIISYFGAILIEKKQSNNNDSNSSKVKHVLVLSIVLLLSALIVFKYMKFILENIDILAKTEFSVHYNIFLPIGLSFYTFQAVSYVVDVYRGDCVAEKNFFKHALFISFFPQMLQGPISGLKRIRDDLLSVHAFNYYESIQGLRRIAWGVFKKLVIANRIELAITPVFAYYSEYDGITLWIALFLYAIEIYADFSGYMDIIVGFSRILGIKVMENFDTPYFSKSVAEFWRRWHISLGEWFRNYLFYPVLRSRRIEKFRKKLKNSGRKNSSRILPTIIALAVVWISTGIWHGASWQYIVYGCYYGIIIILSTCFEKKYVSWRNSTPVISNSTVFQLVRIVRTFVIVLIGYAFFRSISFSSSISIILKLFSSFEINNAVSYVVENGLNIAVAGFGTVLLFVTDVLKYKKKTSIQQTVDRIPMGVRWGGYIAFIFIIVTLGSFSGGAFLYFQF